MTLVRIRAADYWNATAIELVSGRQYRLRAKGTWHDAWISCGPSGYESPNAYMRWFEHLRRAPTQNWFALMGAFDRNDRNAFLIGENAVITPERDCVLLCFANDVPFGYWNNWGEVALQVELAETFGE